MALVIGRSSISHERVDGAGGHSIDAYHVFTMLFLFFNFLEQPSEGFTVLADL